MKADSTHPVEIEQLLALLEEGLRRRGFTEVVIKRARKSNRAIIAARLSGEQHR